MYSIEYRWTQVEIDVTTQSITAVKLSIQKDQFIPKLSKTTQEHKFTVYTSPVLKIVKNTLNEITKAKKTKMVARLPSLSDPNSLPKNFPLKNPVVGKVKTNAIEYLYFY